MSHRTYSIDALLLGVLQNGMTSSCVPHKMMPGESVLHTGPNGPKVQPKGFPWVSNGIGSLKFSYVFVEIPQICVEKFDPQKNHGFPIPTGNPAEFVRVSRPRSIPWMVWSFSGRWEDHEIPPDPTKPEMTLATVPSPDDGCWLRHRESIWGNFGVEKLSSGSQKT